MQKAKENVCFVVLSIVRVDKSVLKYSTYPRPRYTSKTRSHLVINLAVYVSIKALTQTEQQFYLFATIRTQTHLCKELSRLKVPLMYPPSLQLIRLTDLCAFVSLEMFQENA